jgi:cardiolipin synthase A/B
MRKKLLYIFLAVYILTMAYYRFRRTPPGINGRKARYFVSGDRVRFLHDTTWYEGGWKKSEQQIFDATCRAIKGARKFIVMDYFLFNDLKYDPREHLDTTKTIIELLREKNDLPRYFISDPLNIGYGTDYCRPMVDLAASGTRVIFCDLDKLPDNIPIYSGIWRMFFQWFSTKGPGIITNPMRKRQKTTIRALLKGLNGKADHRKLLVADDKVIVSSSNLDNLSSYNSNTGIMVEDQRVARHYLEAEAAVAKMSGEELSPILFDRLIEKSRQVEDDIQVRPLMGKEIKKSILRDLADLGPQDRVFIAMLFIADRKIINLLRKKARLGTEVTLLLDDNQVSFGHKKRGLPNSYLAPEFVEAGFRVYFFRDKRNEYHSKLIFIEKDMKAIINTGSANLTRRSLLGTNLENNIRIVAPRTARVVIEAKEYADKIIREPFSAAIQKTARILPAGQSLGTCRGEDRGSYLVDRGRQDFLRKK